VIQVVDSVAMPTTSSANMNVSSVDAEFAELDGQPQCQSVSAMVSSIFII